MWIMTSDGFVALAASDRPQWELQVRARDRETLQKIRSRYPTTERSKIFTTLDRDYEYRFYTTKAAFAEVAAAMIIEIDYQKFKPTTERRGRGGRKVHDLYVALWYVIARHYRSPILGRSSK
jgi:hypothetical protein